MKNILSFILEMCFDCLLAFLSLKNVRYIDNFDIWSIHMYVIELEVNEMNELVCVSVFNPVTFSEAYPDIDHYKVCLFSNQCSNLFQTSDVGRQLTPDVLSPNFFFTPSTWLCHLSSCPGMDSITRSKGAPLRPPATLSDQNHKRF